MSKKPAPQITPEMTVLDIVSHFRQTQAVFEQYEISAGECICCHALFESLEAVDKKYNLNLDKLVCSLGESLQQSP